MSNTHEFFELMREVMEHPEEFPYVCADCNLPLHYERKRFHCTVSNAMPQVCPLCAGTNITTRTK